MTISVESYNVRYWIDNRIFYNIQIFSLGEAYNLPAHKHKKKEHTTLALYF